MHISRALAGSLLVSALIEFKLLNKKMWIHLRLQRFQLRIARQNGVTQEELIEAITHIAFYAGWPNAITAIGVAKEVFGAK